MEREKRFRSLQEERSTRILQVHHHRLATLVSCDLHFARGAEMHSSALPVAIDLNGPNSRVATARFRYGTLILCASVWDYACCSLGGGYQGTRDDEEETGRLNAPCEVRSRRVDRRIRRPLVNRGESFLMASRTRLFADSRLPPTSIAGRRYVGLALKIANRWIS